MASQLVKLFAYHSMLAIAFQTISSGYDSILASKTSMSEMINSVPNIIQKKQSPNKTSVHMLFLNNTLFLDVLLTLL